MKTIEICKGVKETSKSIIVDLDEYLNRTRYYTGTLAGRVIRFSKIVHPDLFQEWNSHYECKLDMLIARHLDGEEIKGVTVQSKGFVIE